MPKCPQCGFTMENPFAHIFSANASIGGSASCPRCGSSFAFSERAGSSLGSTRTPEYSAPSAPRKKPSSKKASKSTSNDLKCKKCGSSVPGDWGKNVSGGLCGNCFNKQKNLPKAKKSATSQKTKPKDMASNSGDTPAKNKSSLNIPLITFLSVIIGCSLLGMSLSPVESVLRNTSGILLWLSGITLLLYFLTRDKGENNNEDEVFVSEARREAEARKSKERELKTKSDRKSNNSISTCNCPICQEMIEAFDDVHDSDECASYTNEEKIKQEVTYSYDDVLSDYILDSNHPKENRLLALERATDVQKIQQLVMDDDDREVGIRALERLKELDAISSCVDDSFYCKAALSSRSDEIRIEAVKSIIDLDVLEKVAQNKNKQVQQAALKAIENIQKSQNIGSQDTKKLVEMVYSKSNVKLRKKAVKQITDQSKLKEIALNHSDTNIRQEAIEQMTDKDMLIDVFHRSDDWDRETAKTRLVTLFDLWV